VLFRVALRPGTRLLRLDLPPDRKVLDTLKREFGKVILVKNPLKVMPHNKRLTLNEAVQLARYHVAMMENLAVADRDRVNLNGVNGVSPWKCAFFQVASIEMMNS